MSRTSRSIVDVAGRLHVSMDLVLDVMRVDADADHHETLARLLGASRHELSTAPRGEWRPHVYEVETQLSGARIAYHDQRVNVVAEWSYESPTAAIAALAEFLVLRRVAIERARRYATRPTHVPDEPQGWVRSTWRPRGLLPFRRREYVAEGEGVVVREWASS